jgi:tRNA(Arg) A34 adenosine deaminase TadA
MRLHGQKHEPNKALLHAEILARKRLAAQMRARLPNLLSNQSLSLAMYT